MQMPIRNLVLGLEILSRSNLSILRTWRLNIKFPLQDLKAPSRRINEVFEKAHFV